MILTDRDIRGRGQKIQNGACGHPCSAYVKGAAMAIHCLFKKKPSPDIPLVSLQRHSKDGL